MQVHPGNDWHVKWGRCQEQMETFRSCPNAFSKSYRCLQNYLSIGQIFLKRRLSGANILVGIHLSGTKTTHYRQWEGYDCGALERPTTHWTAWRTPLPSGQECRNALCLMWSTIYRRDDTFAALVPSKKRVFRIKTMKKGSLIYLELAEIWFWG